MGYGNYYAQGMRYCKYYSKGMENIIKGVRMDFQYNDSLFLHPAIFCRTCTHTRAAGWWKVDLEELYYVHSVVIYNRVDPCCAARLDGVEVKTISLMLIRVVWF